MRAYTNTFAGSIAFMHDAVKEIGVNASSVSFINDRAIADTNEGEVDITEELINLLSNQL